MIVNPATIKLASELIPLLVIGVKEGADIIERLQAGDESAIDQAKDWLGVTDKVSAAIDNWEASKTAQP